MQAADLGPVLALLAATISAKLLRNASSRMFIHFSLISANVKSNAKKLPNRFNLQQKWQIVVKEQLIFKMLYLHKLKWLSALTKRYF